MALIALFAGASGLRANSSALDTIGNNLANINTTAFKAQRALFRDMVYQTTAAGSAPSSGLGGTNPIQIGSGTSVGAIDNLFEQGSITPTNRLLDAAIRGNGFFVVRGGSSTAYTRTGSFSVDAGGFLVDPNTGFRVQRTGLLGEATATTPGFQIVGNQDVRVPIGVGLQGVQTSNVILKGNLSTELQIGDTATTAIQVYDSQSTPRALTMTFTKTAVNTFSVSATISGGTATATPTPVTFDTSGLLVGPATLDVAITGIPGAANQTITLDLGAPGQTTGLSQAGNGSSVVTVTQDGSGFGSLTEGIINANGQLAGLFTNGRTVPLAQLAIAGFSNTSGLLRSGQNYFAASAASGEAIVGAAGEGGRGTVQGGALEGANVDIAVEFAQLIIAQRGFQVNARTITASNETLQELANIIR